MRKLTRHHRKPKAQGGTGEPRNISYVPPNKHDAWTRLFPGDWTMDRIVDEINRVYLDPEFIVILERR